MKTKIILLLLLSTTVFGLHAQKQKTKLKKGMVKVTILYPNETDKTFNMTYYTNTHMPLVAELFGDALKHYAIDKGVSGRAPEEPATYVAVGYLYFDTVLDYQNAFKTHGEKILADIPNYTDIRPVLQISEIIKR